MHFKLEFYAMKHKIRDDFDSAISTGHNKL